MKARHCIPSAVMLFLVQEDRVLLQRRLNTGYMDGCWDCGASGHVETGESMRQAMVREAREELGVEIAVDDLEFATMTHKYALDDGRGYVNVYFIAHRYRGEPCIMEPNKCAEIAWFSIQQLPVDLIADRRQAWENFHQAVMYDEEIMV